MATPHMMRAMRIETSADGSLLVESQVPVPKPNPHDVLIKVSYAGLNRADVMQRQGTYPAPDDAPADIPGLEVSGHIVALGEGVVEWSVGDAVCALLSGGGYGEYALARSECCLPIPQNLGLKEAAALPECVTTVWMTLFDIANLQPGERVLVHGGSSGIGTTAIQMVRAHGCEIIITAGSKKKCDACEKLGATTINYQEADFVEIIRDAGGVDVILDMVGGDYIGRNFKCLKSGGRMVSIACLNGSDVSFGMGGLLMKRLSWTGCTLRSRTIAEKANYIRHIRQTIWPLVEAGEIAPVIDSQFPLTNAMAAQEKMENSLHIGKILLQVSS